MIDPVFAQIFITLGIVWVLGGYAHVRKDLNSFKGISMMTVGGALLGTVISYGIK